MKGAVEVDSSRKLWKMNLRGVEEWKGVVEIMRRREDSVAGIARF